MTDETKHKVAIELIYIFKRLGIGLICSTIVSILYITTDEDYRVDALFSMWFYIPFFILLVCYFIRFCKWLYKWIMKWK